MPSEESGVSEQDSEESATGTIVSQAATSLQVSTQPSTLPSSSANTNTSERAGLAQSHALFASRNVQITGGQFQNTLGPHISLAVHVNHSTSEGSPADSQSESKPSPLNLNGTNNDSPAQFSYQSSQHNHERKSQVSSQSQEISSQKPKDIYERHLTLKERGFPLWIPDPDQNLHLDCRRTGVRIGDVGIITDSGAFFFLFNICLPHNDPVNPRMLPEHFAPISPPIEVRDIGKFRAFKKGSHLASASVKISQSSSVIPDIIFESSASEGAILTMPRGARSEDLRNKATFRKYAAANIVNWYRYANGPRGLEAKNGEIRLVVGFDKTTSWGIATFTNQTQQNSCRLKFGPLEGDSTSTTYTWSQLQYSGVADVKAGPDSDEIDELIIDSDPSHIQFENQCLFVRTLNATLADDVWADIHSTSGTIPVDSQYPRAKNYFAHWNNPDNGSDFSPSQGAQSGTQGRLQDIHIKPDVNPPIFVSGPVESIATTSHPSKVLNDALLAKIPTAKMVITHDGDWSSQYDTLRDPHELVANILASRDICDEIGVVFLEAKKIINEIPGPTSMDHAQVPEAALRLDQQILPSPQDPRPFIPARSSYSGDNREYSQYSTPHFTPHRPPHRPKPPTVPENAHSSTTTTSNGVDCEPDDEWKQNLRKKIEEGLQSMVEDAGESHAIEMIKAPDTPEIRKLLEDDYEDAMQTIRNLAADQFKLELDLERNQRRWTAGVPLTPDWSRFIRQEQQNIMNNIKQSNRSHSPPISPFEVWKPAISPAEDAALPQAMPYSLKRRGSTTSMRSTGSGASIRPSITETIFEPAPSEVWEPASFLDRFSSLRQFPATTGSILIPRHKSSPDEQVPLSSQQPPAWRGCTKGNRGPNFDYHQQQARSPPEDTDSEGGEDEEDDEEDEGDEGDEGDEEDEDDNEDDDEGSEEGVEAKRLRDLEARTQRVEMNRKDELRRMELEIKQLAVEKARKKEEEWRDEVRRKEEEANRREEEARKKEEDIRKLEEEVKRREEDATRKVKEAKRMEEVAKRREEEARKKEEEIQKLEEEVKRKEEDATRKAEEAKRMEEVAKKKEAEAKRKEKDARLKELDAEKKEEAAKQKVEEARQKAEELSKKEEEAKQREAQLEQDTEKTKKMQLETQKIAEDLKKKEEEANRKYIEMKEREDVLRRREAELMRREADNFRREQEAREEEARKWEEESKEKARKDEEAKEAVRRDKETRKEKVRQEEAEREEMRKTEEARRVKARQEEEARESETRMREEAAEARKKAAETKREEDNMRRKLEAEEAKRNAEEAAKRREEDFRCREEARLEGFRREQEEKRIQIENQHFEDMFFDVDPNHVGSKTMVEQLNALQQAEFRKRMEDIRRTREVRKRNDSVGNDGAWANPSYLSNSPGTSPTMSRSPPQLSSIPERSAVGPANGWGAGPAPACGPSINQTATAFSRTVSRPSASTSKGKPRTSSVSSGTHPTSSSPHTVSFSEAERARKQQEFAESQQEQFRRAQERLEAERQLKSAGRPLSREELQRVFDHHERLWTRLNTLDELSWNDFPWPMIRHPSNLDDMSLSQISAYIQSPLYPDEDKTRTPKDRIKEHIERWHPDRFGTKLLPKVVEDEREKVKHGAGNVARYLSDLLRKENESNNNNIFGD